ncbi:hypothetical protein RR46_01295 [Papilio xuthus]|uniref:Uncharacterized protein n=1 Tax=Papilio xuthus TaxID=66420 RepID=A0A0N0PA94_PAPXU|nr:hypothetical protein RR46_01295 [Papilio xuthus]
MSRHEDLPIMDDGEASGVGNSARALAGEIYAEDSPSEDAGAHNDKTKDFENKHWNE